MERLATVILLKDIPNQGLRKGDLGAVVEVYEPDTLEVEFVIGTGKTQALVTLKMADVQPIDRANIPDAASTNPWLYTFGRSTTDPDFSELLEELESQRNTDIPG